MAEQIETEGAPRPVGPYSQAVSAGGVVFVSGQLGIDPVTGMLVGGGVRAEAERSLRNLEAILAKSGCGLDEVVKTTIFVTDMSSFKEVNEAYSAFFKTRKPARSTVGVAALPLGAKVEIEAIAVRSRA